MTDGVVDATNKRGEFFGAKRLEKLLNNTQAASEPADIVNIVKAQVHTFADGAEPADDLTLLSVRWA